MIAHEFEHLRMETAARAAGVNRLFTTPPAQVAVAERSLEKEMRKIRSRRAGDAAQVERFLATLIPGLLTQLYNLPLDCFINRRIHVLPTPGSMTPSSPASPPSKPPAAS